MQLNEEQAAALERIKLRKNIFLTGPAGAGKSFLIRAIVGWATDTRLQIGLTAMTGCAALLLGSGAKTLHSWAGIGLGRGDAQTLAGRMIRQTKEKWKRTDVLVVDEISMMTPELLAKLDIIGRVIRCNHAPFGGIQIILCGDFFQLPPVVRGISGEVMGRFAFESSHWKELNLEPVVLKRIERQADLEFQQLLNECRVGRPSEASINLLKSRQGLDWKSLTIKPTLLFSRNADVDAINEKNLYALNKPLKPFEAKTSIRVSIEHRNAEIPTGDTLFRYIERLDNDSNYAKVLTLCLGCQVMLLVNKDVDHGLVNGSRGVIVDFQANGLPVVQFRQGAPIPIDYHEWESNDSPVLFRSQIPLRVAYALTIHKSQGATLDCALIDIGKSTFECGQAYVALSRVRNIESLYVWNLDPSRIHAHSTVVQFYETNCITVAAPAVDPVVAPVVAPAVAPVVAPAVAPVVAPAVAPVVAPAVDPAAAPATLTASPWRTITDPAWRTVVDTWASTPAGQACLTYVNTRRATSTVYPPPEMVLAALELTPLDTVKVVLLGQDPYHGAGQAHGLSFSVQPGTPLPPSLKNIRKECLADLGQPESEWPLTRGDLSNWARQGVLLLNTSLTVEEGNPNSHSEAGWTTLTQTLLEAVVNTNRPRVFLAWGKHAQNTIQKLTLGAHQLVLSSAHPSPLSAHRGYFGSKPFSQVNSHLERNSIEPIQWFRAP